MKIRSKNNDAEKRMLDTVEAAAYIGMGISKTREILERIGAKRSLGRRTIYDKVVIDRWLDGLTAGED